MALSSLGAGMLGAASGVNAMLRGQIRGEMARQQEAMQRSQQAFQGEQLRLQRDQLTALRQQQRDALQLDYRTLEETIRSNKEKAAVDREEAAASVLTAGLKAAGDQTKGVFSQEDAIKLEGDLRQKRITAFESDLKNYTFDTASKTFTGFTPEAQTKFEELQKAMDSEDIMRTGALNWQNAQQPVSRRRAPEGNIVLMSDMARVTAKTLEEDGRTPEEIVSSLTNPKLREWWRLQIGLSDEEIDNLLSYYQTRMGSVR